MSPLPQPPPTKNEPARPSTAIQENELYPVMPTNITTDSPVPQREDLAQPGEPSTRNIRPSRVRRARKLFMFFVMPETGKWVSS